MKRLTKEQMKTVVGGVEQQYQCSCINGGGTWNYSHHSAPSQATLENDIHNACHGGNAECGYVTCGNPGAPC